MIKKKYIKTLLCLSICATLMGCTANKKPAGSDSNVQDELQNSEDNSQDNPQSENEKSSENSQNSENNTQDISNNNAENFDSESPVSSDATEGTFGIETIPVNVIDDAYRTTYEIFVYSFCDSNGDGIGDLQGVIDKLDYINDGDDATATDLGCNSIWLMPVCPSPTYHKYDVTDYMDIDPEYGTIDDYKKLIDEAHKREIHVINDMVMNHTSSQHPWFKEAKDYLQSLSDGQEPDAAECPYVDYYHFTKEAQTGYEKLPGTDWYYECRFWSEMPDLNLDNEKVQQEFADIAKFWLDLGCDGFRMDAVTSFTTDNTGASTEELGKFVSAVKAIKPDAYIVGEAWTGSATYSQYYASGIDSLFDFDFSGSEGPIAKCAKGKMNPAKYVQAQIDEDALFTSYNENYINAPFYTNHDMARSAGYYVGKEATDSIKLAGALNLLMSGNAYIYYGEELGMKGSGKDENKRAPMQWGDLNGTAAGNAGNEENDADSEDASSAGAIEKSGMTKGPKDMEKVEMPYGTLADQIGDPDSIYNYYKKAIRIRNAFPAIARGKCSILEGLSGDKSVVWMKDASWINDELAASDGYTDPILIALNNGKEQIQVDLGKDEKAAGFRTLAATLSTGSEEATLDGDILTVPTFGIAVLTKGN